MNLTRYTFTVCALLLLTAALYAQPPFDSMGPRRGRMQGMGPNMKMEGDFENLRLLKMMETIDLTEAQSDKFLPLFRTFRKDMRDLRQSRRTMIDRLRDLVKDSASDDKLRAAIAELRNNQKQADSRMQKFMDDCAAVLTVQQTARLAVFQEDFEREVFDAIQKYRHRDNPQPDEKI
jgi:Spy/CpxP family protein refolding chaperone